MKKTIHTDRLVLRTPSVSDVSALVQALNNYEITKWLAKVPHPYTDVDAQQFIAANADKAHPTYHIYHDGRLIGGVGLGGLVGLGYWLIPDAWGKGYVTEASSALLARHFVDADAQAVASGYQSSNLGSAKVQAKLGFRIVSQTNDTDPVWGDYMHENTELTRADWLAVHNLPIKSSDLSIRPFTLRDAPALQRMVGNDQVAPMMARVTSPWPLKDVQNWIIQGAYSGQMGFRLGVTLPDETLIGFVGMSGDPANLAYFIDQSHWGQGYATRAAKAVIDFTFSNFEIDAIEADAFTDNIASHNVLQKLGFEKTGEAMAKSQARLDEAPTILYRLTRATFKGR